MNLRRSLGLADVVFFFVVAGSNLQWVATAAAAGPSSLLVWVIGAFAMFFPLSIAVIHLSEQYPDEGGMYLWSKRAFGPFAGFITGWTYWCSNLPYFPALLYFTAGNALFIAGGEANRLANSPAYFIIVALAGLVLATALNIFGLDVGKWLNNIGAAGRWIVTLLLIALGALAWWKFGPATAINAAAIRPGMQLRDVIFWSTIAFAWTGPESLPFMAGEVRNPRRAIPLGLAIAAPAIAIIYIAGTASVLATVSSSNVSPLYGVMQSISHAAASFGATILIPIAAILVTVSCLGSVGAWLGVAARIPFVAGIDHYLPDAFGRMNPRFGSPDVALLTQSAIVLVFIVLGQSGASVKSAYNVLVSATVVTTMLPFLFLFASSIKFNGDKVSGENTIRIPGGKFTVITAGCIGFLTTCCAIVLALFPPSDERNPTLAVIKVLFLTALVLGSGVAVYAIGRRRQSKLTDAPIGAPASLSSIEELIATNEKRSPM